MALATHARLAARRQEALNGDDGRWIGRRSAVEGRVVNAAKRFVEERSGIGVREVQRLQRRAGLCRISVGEDERLVAESHVRHGRKPNRDAPSAAGHVGKERVGSELK